MSLVSLNRDITLVRKSTTGGTDDGYGNIIPAEASLVTVMGELQQIERTEPPTAGELSVTEWLLVLEAGEAIDTGDSVIVDGETYEVVGDPWRARSPFRETEDHVEATLRRTAGAESGS